MPQAYGAHMSSFVGNGRLGSAITAGHVHPSRRSERPIALPQNDPHASSGPRCATVLLTAAFASEKISYPQDDAAPLFLGPEGSTTIGAPPHLAVTHRTCTGRAWATTMRAHLSLSNPFGHEQFSWNYVEFSLTLAFTRAEWTCTPDVSEGSKSSWSAGAAMPGLTGCGPPAVRATARELRLRHLGSSAASLPRAGHDEPSYQATGSATTQSIYAIRSRKVRSHRSGDCR
jgi:hypothetical protein